MTYRERRFRCGACGQPRTELLWDTDPVPPCRDCGGVLESNSPSRAKAPGVIGDEIDFTVEHVLCGPDGTPRRYTSKSALDRDYRARGYEPCVRHIGMPGSDKNPHTSRWV